MNRQKNTSSHERLASDRIHREISDRQFGLSMATALLVLSAWRLSVDFEAKEGWVLLVPFLLLLAISILRPSILQSLKKSWLKWGETLSRVTTPLILGLFYLTILFLYSVLMRVAGSFKRFKFRDEKLSSYWVSRKSSRQDSRYFKFQF